MKENSLVLNGWLIPILRAMKSANIDDKSAFDLLDIDKMTINEIESKFQSYKVTQLIQYCNMKTNSNDFSIRIAKQFHAGMFHVLGYAMMSSCTLHKAFECIARFKKVVSNSCKLGISEDVNSLYLNMNVFNQPETNQPFLTLAVVETFLATMVQFSRMLVGEELSPKKLYFSYPKPDIDTAYLNEFFNCEVEFSCANSGLEFDRHQANTQLLGSNAQLSQATENILIELVVRMDKNDLVNMVMSKICNMLTDGYVTQEDIASQLNMSLRNLQRKLKAKGTNYQAILDDTRKSLTLDYLRIDHLTLSEISSKVGYTNMSNFNRAFRRWTGKSPSEYRRSVSAGLPLINS